MVELADTLHGWTSSGYGFGCALVHLSNLHDYRHRDPLQSLPDNEQTDILRHMREYHGGPRCPKPTFEDTVPFLPAVFGKIAENIECYLEQLEDGKQLDA